MSTSSAQDWEALCERKKASAAARIPIEWRLPASILEGVSQDSDRNVLDVPRTCGLLSQREIELTENYDATALLEKLAGGEVSSYDVTLAFSKRAAIAQQLTFFDEALERARHCDEYLATHKTPIGPFHGLPISVKDSFDIVGQPSSIGFVSFLDRPLPEKNAAMIDILLANGAVLYVKTNVPQTMMTADTHNNIWGRTLNPNKLSLTAGGSTGGEGALIAMRGSVLGMGTDIAGSVRIPASACGTFGVRATARRIPGRGVTSGVRPGVASILSSVGPLAHSIRDLGLFMRVSTNSDPWRLDENALTAPWRQVGKKGTLRIGTTMEDAALPLHPPMLRAFKSAVQKLEAAGHTVIPIDDMLPATLDEAARVANSFFIMDPSKHNYQHVIRSGEPPIPSLAISTYPGLADGFVADLDKLYSLNIERGRIATGWRQIIVSQNLDVILSPVYQTTAPRHDTFGISTYAAIYNLLDYPAVAIPYGRADKVLDAPFIRNVKYYPEYSPESFEGAPCSLQIAGTHMRDEELLRDAQTIADVLLGA